MQSSVLYCKKTNNYLNIKGKKLYIYFWITLIVIQRSLRTEFANMFFLSLLQAKGAFLRLARDVVKYGCGLPYIRDTQFGLATSHHLHSYAKRQNNQQLYCWLPDGIYADYGNSGKQAYTLTHSRTAQYSTEQNGCGVVPIPNPWMCESPYMATPRANLGTCHQLGLNFQLALLIM
jgi:hypothetical protein